MRAAKQWEAISEACKLLYGISRVPIHIMEGPDQLVMAYPRTSLMQNLKLSPSLQQKLVERVARGPVMGAFNAQLLYACMAFELEKTYYVFIGPGLLSRTNLADLADIEPVFGGEDVRLLFELLSQMPQVDVTAFTYLVRAVYFAIFEQPLKLDEIQKDEQEWLVPGREDLQDLAVLPDTERPLGRTYLINVMHIEECIRDGDIQRLKALIDSGNGTAVTALDPPDYPWEDPLRRAKNLVIAANVVFTRAAVASGLDMEEVTPISKRYVHRAENCEEIQELVALADKMALDFAECVAGRKKGRALSQQVARAQRYIYHHLHFDITLKDLAAYVHLSPRYLSHIFKEEVGISVVDYIQLERVEEAKKLLRFSSYSFAEISRFLNFASQSYFIKIFQKHTGLTPLQYRKQSGRGKVVAKGK